MNYKVKPTQLQKSVAEKILENIEKGTKKPLGQILRECGYSDLTSRNPFSVLSSKGFQQFLKGIDDTKIIAKWQKWALSDKDKRVAMEAGKEIMKLKDRYPAAKLKIQEFEQEIDEVIQDDEVILDEN